MIEKEKYAFDFKDGEIPNPWYDRIRKENAILSKIHMKQLNQYVQLHIKPKPKRMHQKTYEKLLSKLLQLTYFEK
jgi:hypothetical protein